MATLMTGLDWVRRRKPDTGTTLIDSRGQGSTLNTCAEHAPVHLARLMFHQGPQGDERVTGIVSKPFGRRRTLLPMCLTVVALVTLLASCSESQAPRTRSLLVVGDSVATQSAQALIHLAPAGTTVTVDTVRPGTAPCDWNHGFTDPTDHKYRFREGPRRGPPGSGRLRVYGEPRSVRDHCGLRRPNRPYDLAQLLASYEPALVEMADKATSAGATVYFEAPPPRNPAVPVGYDSQTRKTEGSTGLQVSQLSMKVWRRRTLAIGDTATRQQWRCHRPACPGCSHCPARRGTPSSALMDRSPSGPAVRMLSISTNMGAVRFASPLGSRRGRSIPLHLMPHQWPLPFHSTAAVGHWEHRIRVGRRQPVGCPG